MRKSFSVLWRRGAIIGLLLALLGGCSTLRLGYGQGPQLAWWWLDRQVDIDAEQAPRVRAAIDQWFAWHRQTQLADYAGLLARARTEAEGSLTAGQVCRFNDQLRDRIDPAFERILPAAAELAPTLSPAQLAHLEQQLAKSLDKFRRDLLQPDPAERQREASERLIDRFEGFYGSLDSSQRRQIADAAATSPFDPAAWAADREARQLELLALLRRIADERPEPQRVQGLLRGIFRRFDGSAVGPLQSRRLRLAQHHCELVARIHNGATPAQRQHLRRKLAGWEADLRHLAGERGGALAQQSAAPSARP